MIIFATYHDPETISNCQVAEELTEENDIALLHSDAHCANLISHLSTNAVVFIMAHGNTNLIVGQPPTPRITFEDLQLIRKKKFYVFACCTADELGRDLCQNDNLYFGYTGSITELDLEKPEFREAFLEIFKYIKDNFFTINTTAQSEIFLNDLRNMCEYFRSEIASCGSIKLHYSMRDIWQRIRIWLPNSQLPEKHPLARIEPIDDPEM
ncbi:hypothetical protein [Candidatus Uabimicrobium sp. HlEnr_7]|uniref:hypothetical protein n=1 Tax=Candidatus Uabimicrobium helgolandensis TaxID=3095367 RepID=UPI0035565DC6